MAIDIRQAFRRLVHPSGGDEPVASLEQKLHKAWAAREGALEACRAHARGGASKEGSAEKKKLLARYLRADNAVYKLEEKLADRGRFKRSSASFSWSGQDEIEELFGQSHPPVGSRRPQPDEPDKPANGPPKLARRTAPPPRPRPPASPAETLRRALGCEATATYTSREAGIAGADLAALQVIGADLMAAARKHPGLASTLLAATANDSQIRRVRFALHPDQIGRSRTLSANSRADHLEKASLIRDIFEKAITERSVLAGIASDV